MKRAPEGFSLFTPDIEVAPGKWRRVFMCVPEADFIAVMGMGRGLGQHVHVYDYDRNMWRIEQAECDLPNCNCAVRAIPVEAA